MTDDPIQTLRRIELGLAHPTIPAALIEEMLPRTRDEAVTWAGRFPGWDEYRGRFPGRVIALARIVSRRARKEHGLQITEDGRVADRGRHAPPWPTPEPSHVFALLDGTVRVEYTPGYFFGKDHFQFKSPHDPVRPMPLSPTGWLSHFADSDAVEAVGGPEAFAALYAEAVLRDRDKEFEEGFEGKAPKVKRPEHRPKPARPKRPVIGEHTGGVTGSEDGHEGAEPGPEEEPPPGRLF